MWDSDTFAYCLLCCVSVDKRRELCLSGQLGSHCAWVWCTLASSISKHTRCSTLRSLSHPMKKTKKNLSACSWKSHFFFSKIMGRLLSQWAARWWPRNSLPYKITSSENFLQQRVCLQSRGKYVPGKRNLPNLQLRLLCISFLALRAVALSHLVGKRNVCLNWKCATGTVFTKCWRVLLHRDFLTLSGKWFIIVVVKTFGYNPSTACFWVHTRCVEIRPFSLCQDYQNICCRF